MTFKEYLISTGVSEEQATSIVEGMPTNKFYLPELFIGFQKTP